MTGYGLFCTAEVPVTLIDQILRLSALPENNPPEPNEPFEPKKSEFRFWLATSTWPKTGDWKFAASTPVDAHRTYPAPTVPPVVESFSSPYLGLTPWDVRRTLEAKSAGAERVDVHDWSFAIVDARTARDGSVLVCKVEDDEDEGTEALGMARCHPYIAASVFCGLLHLSVEEVISCDPNDGSGGVALEDVRRDATLLPESERTGFEALLAGG